ncbi:lipase member H-like [Thrips palmi]|uniref:Lipase member H-like n=1 Tax=Thrips palmi TaxID=161013 RepID=A0A6P8ZAL1_THRPL|nr:lipase member H-like [Thrips palmi]
MTTTSWAVVAAVLTMQGLGCVSSREVPSARNEPRLKVEKAVKYYIFTRDAPAGLRFELDSLDSLAANGFDASLSTTIVIHGYGHDITDPLFANVAAALLAADAPTNVLGVDWGVLCPKPLYLTSRSHVQGVGETVAALVQLLVDNGLARLADVHLIGHSLGAHVAGVAGKVNTVGRISGLDPAMPLFFDSSPDRLRPTDADLVDVIHTSAGRLGYRDPTGHVDFYPNGGTVSQPGCGGLFADGLLGSCSHRRAHELYGASIGNRAAFPAKQCDSFKKAIANRCTDEGGPSVNMGYYLNASTPQGVYYLTTTGTKPYTN